MPIGRKAFEKGNFEKRSPTDSLKHPVMKFLRLNNMRAYKVSEIVKATGMKEDTVRGFLQTAKKKKIVEHKIPYFIAVVNNNGDSKKTSSKKKKKKRK